MSNKNLRRLPAFVVMAQTAKNLQKLANMCGYGHIGRVVDKLTREKMMSLHTPPTGNTIRLDATGANAVVLAAEEVSELRQKLAEAVTRYEKLKAIMRAEGFVVISREHPWEKSEWNLQSRIKKEENV